MNEFTIRPMRVADTSEVCEIIGLAFADNPSTLAVARDRRSALRIMRAGVRIAKFDRPCSYALVAGDAMRIVGVLNAAEWPGCQMSLREKLRSAFAMVRIMGTALPRMLKLIGVRANHDPRARHWHVGPIGVHPDVQGRGVGKALLGSFLVTADERGSPVFLETDVDRNVALYEKFGFEIVGEEMILGVNNRFMWRASPRGHVT
jgi:ribosomal protein S18 acetylase RimI-like enzyme